MRRPNALSSFFWLVVSLINLQAQQAAEVPAATLKVTTHLVQVDVVVTNDKGEPITGLTQEDFTIIEDGKQQKLAALTAHLPGQQKTPSEAGRSPLPEGVFSNRSVRTDEGAITIVLLDALNTPLLDQTYARQQMLKYLKAQQESGQRTAILALTSSLFLLQDLTTDGRLLGAALEKRLPSRPVLLDDPDLDRIEMRGAPPQILQALQRFEEEVTAQRTDIRVQTTLAAMQVIARAYGGFPGRKNLVWVSAAFPLMLAPEKIGSLSSRYYGEELRRTAAMLQRTQIAVYPVDARGLVGEPGATFTGRDRGGNLMTGPELAGELADRANLLTDSHGAMQEIAEQTGGRAYYNRNDIDRAVALAIADGSSYYALAYYPENKNWNGKYRKISVKVARPDVHLRHRKGYVASDLVRSDEPKGQAKREVETALFDPILQTMIGLEGGLVVQAEKSVAVPLPAQTRASLSSVQPKTRVGFKVDPQTISFEQTSDGLHAFSVELVATAFDENSKTCGQTSQTVTGKLKPESYRKLMQQGLVLITELETERPFTRIRLLVRDNRTGLMGTLDVPNSTVR